MRTRLLFAIAAAGFGVACEDSIHRGWLVDRPRVLAARVEATAEPERASLAPGESASITWLVSVPEGMPSLDWAFVACVPPEGNFAEPRCDQAVLASGTGSTAGELALMELEVPQAAELGESEELLVLAAFCDEGAPGLDAAAFDASCDEGEPLLASLLVRLEGAGTNLNPPPPASLRLGAVTLAENAGAVAGAPCEDTAGAPEIPAGGSEVDLLYVFEGGEREPDESILLSTLVTGGELDRQYSAFDPEETAPKEARIAWTPPADAGAAGSIVRFYAVLRDGRGGASFGRFAACVRPN